MNDKPPKSKLPDLEELRDITFKFLGDVKKSLCDIYDEYQKRHDETPPDSKEKEEVKKETSATPEASEQEKTQKTKPEAKSSGKKSDD